MVGGSGYEAREQKDSRNTNNHTKFPNGTSKLHVATILGMHDSTCTT